MGAEASFDIPMQCKAMKTDKSKPQLATVGYDGWGGEECIECCWKHRSYIAKTMVGIVTLLQSNENEAHQTRCEPNMFKATKPMQEQLLLIGR